MQDEYPQETADAFECEPVLEAMEVNGTLQIGRMLDL